MTFKWQKRRRMTYVYYLDHFHLKTHAISKLKHKNFRKNFLFYPDGATLFPVRFPTQGRNIHLSAPMATTTFPCLKLDLEHISRVFVVVVVIFLSHFYTLLVSPISLLKVKYPDT